MQSPRFVALALTACTTLTALTPQALALPANSPPSSVSEARRSQRFLSPEAIRLTILHNLGGVSRCHELGLADDPHLEGRVVVTFIIQSQGLVRESVVRETSGVPMFVAECIAKHVGTMQFPPPFGGGIVTVNYPFNLQAPVDSE